MRAFLKQAWTPELAARVDADATHPQAIVEWQRRLFERGWAAPGWPKQHGGCEWTPTQRYIYDVERSAVGAANTLPFGLKMVGPVIIKYGNAEQQQRFLPRILRAQDWWCQGYSEPGAGSDLAALKTRAERAGDDYIVNGSKIWTTYAQHADWMFCLVRTESSARRQDGISFLLIDMKTPGIRIAPIISIDGEHSLNEVFFDNVRVPVANRIGEQDKGWTYAKSLLAHERTAIAGVGDSKRAVRRIRELARRETNAGKPLLDDPVFAARLADIEIELMALEFTELRALWASGQGPGAGRRKLAAEDQGHRSAAGLAAADDGHGRHLRRGAAGRSQLRPRLRRRRAAQLHVRPRLDHLRRLERGAEEHHRQGRARPVTAKEHA